MIGEERDRSTLQVQLEALRAGELSLAQALELHGALEAEGGAGRVAMPSSLRERLRAIPEEGTSLPTAFDDLCLAEMDGDATPDMVATLDALCATYPGYAHRRASFRACRLEPLTAIEYAGKEELKRRGGYWLIPVRQLGRIAAAIAIVALAGVQWIGGNMEGVEPYQELAASMAPAAPLELVSELSEVEKSPSCGIALQTLPAEEVAELRSGDTEPEREQHACESISGDQTIPLMPYLPLAVDRAEMQPVAAVLSMVHYEPVDWEAREMYDELAEVAAYEEQLAEPKRLLSWLDRTSLLIAQLSE